MNSCSDSTADGSSARPANFGDLESQINDVEQLTDIVAHLLEGFTDPLWKQVRGGTAAVLITEAELNRLIWTANECAHRTRLCKDRYFEILEASYATRKVDQGVKTQREGIAPRRNCAGAA